jgi:ribosomal protein S18 acetylase RimI-like enzyme
MTEAPEVVLANTEEREWVAQLLSSIEPWLTIGVTPDAARGVLARPGLETFVARRANDPQPLGFLLLNAHGIASAPYVNSIAVRPDQQRKGIGSALLSFAEHRFSDRRFLYLCVSSFNTEARRLYERTGYEFVAELKDHAVSGYTELLMRKRLRSD